MKKVVSLCGTFLKPEMQSLYRQIVSVKRFQNIVFTEKRSHSEQFPFPAVVEMQKAAPLKRASRKGFFYDRFRSQELFGTFLRRFFYKHVLKQWPPTHYPLPLFGPYLQIHQLPDNCVYTPFCPSSTYNLAALLHLHQPALVHVYYGHKAVKYLPLIQRWGGPLVVSFHGADVTDPLYKNTPGKTAAKSLGTVFEYAALVLARSQSLLTELETLGCPKHKLRLNRAAIPVENIPRFVREIPEDGQWRIFQACRLIAKKGILTSVEAMQKVVKIWPKLRFTIAGEGPLKEEIQTRIRALGLESNIQLVGWQSQSQLQELARASHIFLHPSEQTESNDQEGVPNALLEAMATGLVVVGTYHGGIPEAVVHGRDGILVPEKDPEALANALLEVMQSKDLITKLSIRAPQRIDEAFALEQQVALLEDFYQEGIKKHQFSDV